MRGDFMKQNGYPTAAARIHGDSSHPGICGIVRFFQRENGVIIEAEVTGLPRTETGFFAFHIHDGTNCEGEGFPDADTHFNPGGVLHPNHAGDLPPLLADHGRAYMKFLTGRFHVGEVMGKTIIIHAGPDDFHTQPSGNAGTKIACGIIQRRGGNR